MFRLPRWLLLILSHWFFLFFFYSPVSPHPLTKWLTFLCIFLCLSPSFPLHSFPIPSSLTSCSSPFLVQGARQHPGFSLNFCFLESLDALHSINLLQLQCKYQINDTANKKHQDRALCAAHKHSSVNGNKQLPLFMIKACKSNRFSGCAACIMRLYATVQYCCLIRINAMVRVPSSLQFARPARLL